MKMYITKYSGILKLIKLNWYKVQMLNDEKEALIEYAFMIFKCYLVKYKMHRSKNI